MGGGYDILWWIIRSVRMGVLVELQYVTTGVCSSQY